jgi:hypothetical protein
MKNLNKHLNQHKTHKPKKLLLNSRLPIRLNSFTHNSSTQLSRELNSALETAFKLSEKRLPYVAEGKVKGNCLYLQKINEHELFICFFAL